MLKIELAKERFSGSSLYFRILEQDEKTRVEALNCLNLRRPWQLKANPIAIMWATMAGETDRCLYIGAPINTRIASQSLPAWNSLAGVYSRPLGFESVSHTLFLRGHFRDEDRDISSVCCASCVERLLMAVLVFNMMMYHNSLTSEDLDKMVTTNARSVYTELLHARLRRFLDGARDLSFLSGCRIR